jgi:phosphatidylglycerol---prolipoprotein diacylglyceryl transferase
MLGLSFIGGWYLAIGMARRDRLDPDKIRRCYVQSALWAVIGARLLYFITNPSRITSPGDFIVDFFKVNEGGLVAYGGFLGGLLASWAFCWRNGIPLLQWADCAVPSLGLGLACTRIGCFMFGCDFGAPAKVAWAVRFPKGSPAWDRQVQLEQIARTAALSLPVHPTQIYESLLGLGLLGLTLLVRRWRRFSGEVFLVFFGVYGLVRAYFETLRADTQRGNVGPLTTSEFIGLVSLALTVAGYVFLYRRWKADPQAARLWERPAEDPLPAPRSSKKRR